MATKKKVASTPLPASIAALSGPDLGEAATQAANLNTQLSNAQEDDTARALTDQNSMVGTQQMMNNVFNRRDQGGPVQQMWAPFLQTLKGKNVKSLNGIPTDNSLGSIPASLQGFDDAEYGTDPRFGDDSIPTSLRFKGGR